MHTGLFFCSSDNDEQARHHFHALKQDLLRDDCLDSLSSS